MKYLSLLILFLTVNSYCQNSGRIEYEYIKNLGIDYQTIGVLEFAHNTSKFIELKVSNDKVKINNSNEITVTKNSKYSSINFLDIDNNILYSQFSLFNKRYSTKEEIAKIEWKIINKTKQIGTYECQKAQANFRGRIYNVWFTSKIPVKFGPWKLQGLPGLILEAEDSKSEIIFRAKKITLKNSSEIHLPNFENAVNLEEFVKMKVSIYKERSELIKSKMPRNGTFTLDLPPRHTQLEIIYEWEKE